MKNTTKLTLKILAAIVAIALIVVILLTTNAIVGNPIMSMMATKSIKQYAAQKYSSLDLEIEIAKYNFKSESYLSMAKSKTSIDTKFRISYQDGKVQSDAYEGDVLSMFNTLQRFSDEYSHIAKDILTNKLGYKNTNAMVMYDKSVYENPSDILKLDMKFDISLPIDAEVILRLDLGAASLEAIAKALTDVHNTFVDNSCNFKKYGLSTEHDGILIEVNNVTSADIESGELLARLEEAKNNQESGGIMVFIKGDPK